MHLLVVEDDPRLVRLLRRLLEEDRHIVETATTGIGRPTASADASTPLGTASSVTVVP